MAMWNPAHASPKVMICVHGKLKFGKSKTIELALFLAFLT